MKKLKELKTKKRGSLKLKVHRSDIPMTINAPKIYTPKVGPTNPRGGKGRFRRGRPRRSSLLTPQPAMMGKFFPSHKMKSTMQLTAEEEESLKRKEVLSQLVIQEKKFGFIDFIELDRKDSAPSMPKTCQNLSP